VAKLKRMKMQSMEKVGWACQSETKLKQSCSGCGVQPVGPTVSPHSISARRPILLHPLARDASKTDSPPVYSIPTCLGSS
jgi:hypothetical protein